MSSAAARAEARKKAILARGSDRLSRLTSSARGEGEAAERFTPEPPARTSNFLGEDSPSPSTPPRPTTVPRQSSASPSSRPVSVSGSSPFSGSGADTVPPFNPAAQPDPSVWSADQQQQFMRALMGASLRGGAGGPSDAPESAGALPSPLPNPANGSIPPGADDPFGAMLAALAQQGQSQGQGQGGMPGMQMPMGMPGMPPMPGLEQMQETMSPPAPPTLFKRLLPLVHVLGAWVLLAFFVGWKEPAILGTQGRGGAAVEGFWHRWAGLVHGPARDGWGVQAAPFFWAFITLEIMLFSLRIFTGVDRRAPHMLLAMALPHLPPPLPSLITYGLKYIQMAGVLLDDLAALLVALGAIVWVSGFFGS